MRRRRIKRTNKIPCYELDWDMTAYQVWPWASLHVELSLSSAAALRDTLRKDLAFRI